jgi:hypothetical protein
MNCLFCNGVVNPRSRAYLAKKDEEVNAIINVLNRKYTFSSFAPEKHLKDGVVCKGKCLSYLNKLVKLKKELVTIEHHVMSTFGNTVLRNDLGSIRSDCDLSLEAPTSSRDKEVTGRRNKLLCTPRRRNLTAASVGVTIVRKGKSRFSHLSSSLRAVGRSLGRNNRKSLVNQVLRDQKMKGMV